MNPNNVLTTESTEKFIENKRKNHSFIFPMCTLLVKMFIKTQWIFNIEDTENYLVN